MSKFLEELNTTILRKKITKNKLAIKADVDPSSFYQMLAGKRYLNERLFNKLIHVLNLSPDEEKYLRELYHIMQIGEENYYKNKMVVKFLENLNIEQSDYQVSSFTVQREQISEIIHGRENLNKVIFQILLNAYEKNETLKILCQPEYEVLQLLLGILKDNPNLSVEQIICLESERSDSGIKNISALEKLIPALTGKFRFSIYYFYDSVSTRYGSTSLMPYLIVSDSMGVIFSTDFEDGIFFEKKEKVELFQKRYNKIKRYTSIFTTNDPRLEDIKQTLHGFEFCKEKEAYVLCPMIPLPAYSADFWISLLRPDDKEREKFIRFLQQDNQIATAYAESLKRYSFFTRKGVLDFYENGHIIDALSDHFLPVPVEKRKEIIEKIRDGVLENQINAFLLKDDAISLSRDFYMVVSRENGVNCSRRKNDNTFLMLTFFEDSLCHVIAEFMSNLKKSDLVESGETMIEFLESLL